MQVEWTDNSLPLFVCGGIHLVLVRLFFPPYIVGENERTKIHGETTLV